MPTICSGGPAWPGHGLPSVFNQFVESELIGAASSSSFSADSVSGSTRHASCVLPVSRELRTRMTSGRTEGKDSLLESLRPSYPRAWCRQTNAEQANAEQVGDSSAIAVELGRSWPVEKKHWPEKCPNDHGPAAEAPTLKMKRLASGLPRCCRLTGRGSGCGEACLQQTHVVPLTQTRRAKRQAEHLRLRPMELFRI